MVLGSTQPLMEMSTRNLSGGKGRPARGTENLTVICKPIVQEMWEPRRLTTLWVFMACYRDSLIFLFNSERWMVGWLVYWKGFERKLPRSNWGAILALAWRH
jgi:hypothetical protein